MTDLNMLLLCLREKMSGLSPGRGGRRMRQLGFTGETGGEGRGEVAATANGKFLK